MPEYLQNQAVSQAIASESFEMITNLEKQAKMKSELLSVKKKLQGSGASKRAAEYILSLLESK